MTTLALAKNSEELHDTLHRVKEGVRVVLEEDGAPVGALVSIDDFQFLEDLENRLDLEQYRAAMRKDAGKPTIPWETLKHELGL